MTPQERELIEGVIRRVNEAAGSTPPLDPEADRLIRDGLGRQPAALYLLVQAVLVQDQALRQAQARIAQLEADLARAREAPQPAPAPATSFLPPAGTTSPWATSPRPAAPATPPPLPMAPAMPTGPAMPATPAAAAGPWSPFGSGGGGFLRNALQTAAGVAGGALLAEGIGSLLHHGWGSGFVPQQPQTVIEEIIVDPQQQDARQHEQAAFESAGGLYQDAPPAGVDPAVWPDDASDPGSQDDDTYV
ncbi:DUF2076 domain-containing protein [Benzoatithermus flavus]|uniref:DUF2076 domain-containing protein n=1 Tax=Benzoatithermus flavus TaxID=3108223 RepID=A0ABU8XKU0_9PROT